MKSSDGRFEYRDNAGKPVPPGSKPEDVHRIAFQCRSEPGRWCSVNLRGRGHDIENRSWTWNGDFDKPTLSPSINCSDDHCWHGYITAGVYTKQDRRTPEPKQ